MSPRAAGRLETLGFEHVYDYVTGKSDWLARGLPLDGDAGPGSRAIDFARDPVVTCGLSDRVGAVREHVRSSPFGFALVISDSGLLLGRLRAVALAGEPDAEAQAVMEPGPSTVRANMSPAQLRERLEGRKLATAVITDPDGHLRGVVRLADLPVES